MIDLIQSRNHLFINMEEDQEIQICEIDLAELYEKADECEIKIIGTLKTIFKHKKYIVDMYIGKKLVLRSFKRYNQFEALNEVFRLNFKNIDLEIGDFPSKYQIFNKEETRRQFFQNMLNTMIKMYRQKITNDINRRILSTLFIFLANTRIKKSGGHESDKSVENISQRNQLRKNSIDSAEDVERETKSLNQLIVYASDKLNNLQIVKQFAPNDDNNIQRKKVRMEEKPMQEEANHFKNFIKTQFLIKFDGEKEWKERYLKLENSCLLIYKHKNENNFKTKIELYQAKIQYLHREKNIFDHFCEKMEIDNAPTFQEDHEILAISHDYDYRKLLIKKKSESMKDAEMEEISTQTIKELLLKSSFHESIKESFDGVFSPIGKIFIVFHKIKIEWLIKMQENYSILLRVKSSSLEYQTKRVFCNSDVLYVKQAFQIPISNSFENIVIEAIALSHQGIIRQEEQEQCIGVYRIPFADLMSFPSGYGLEKIHIKVELEDQEIQKPFQAIIEISLQNQSHFTSIYADSFSNENDGIVMSGIQSTSDTGELVRTVNRVLRVLGNIALFIQAFWRNVYLFKYPRLAYLFFTSLLCIFLFGDASSFFEILVTVVVFAMVYNMPLVQPIIISFLNAYFFNVLHQNFIPPQLLSKSEVKFLKWSLNLESIHNDYNLTLDGKLAKKSSVKDRKYVQFRFCKHNNVFIVREDEPGILETLFQIKKVIELVHMLISAAINTIEKICNIFAWADPRRSVIIFLLLMLILNIANIYLIRGIGCIFCIHRFLKGKEFYRHKHYKKNKKLALYSIKYIINKSFPFLLLAKQKKIKLMEQEDLDIFFQEVSFPIHDEEKAKKLKLEIEELIGVFIDIEDLGKRSEQKNNLKISTLVEMIETCQSRLKLEWISGKEGVSNEFQELKRMTQEELVIDLWVESLLINFFLNIPSQLYTTFRKIRSKEKVIYQNNLDSHKDFIKVDFSGEHPNRQDN